MKYRLIMALTVILVSSCSRFDSGTQCRTADELTAQGKYKEAIILYNKVISKSEGKDIHYIAMARLAQCYYYAGDYALARETSEKLLISIPEHIDPRASLAAKMVLLSLERKASRNSKIHLSQEESKK